MVTYQAPNRVREARLAAGMSLNDLAREVGCTPQGIWFLETKAKRLPTGISVDRLALALSTTVEDLFPTVAA